MEIFFVYGLVLIFFIALPLVLFMLIKEPARDPGTEKSQQASSRNTGGTTSSQLLGNIASYGLLVAIFALLFIVSVASQRSHS